jgi:citrate lyase subunit beta/citryl-CoA lyase
LDLEDSVAAAAKPSARALAADVLRSNPQSRLYVRVNALDTGLTLTDLQAVLPARPKGLILPKSESAAAVNALHALIMMVAPGDEVTPVIAIATETAKSIFQMGSYVDAHPRLEGLNWGMEDLAAALGAQTNRDEQGVAPIDAVYAKFRDHDGLVKQCREAARDGFTAKMCIHPDQVGPINEAFTPSPEAIARARSIVSAFAKAGNPGVLAVDGEMLDAPHLKAAQALLRRVH